MNISYTFQRINFEWDKKKATSNFSKHKVLFETACEVFFDPFLIGGDAELIESEQRETVVGATANLRLLMLLIQLEAKSFALFRRVSSLNRKEIVMKINDLKKRLTKDRSMSELNLRVPEDVLEDLRRIAPQLGFSNVEALIRAYIGQGLRKDLEKLEQSPEFSTLIESLRRKGVKDEVLADAVAELATLKTA